MGGGEIGEEGISLSGERERERGGDKVEEEGVGGNIKEEGKGGDKETEMGKGGEEGSGLGRV